jgi:hypothetical protein
MNANRIKKWVNISFLTNLADFHSDIQQLGQAELIILNMESECKNLIDRQNQPHYDFNKEANPYLLNQLVGFSKYWIFGLYEVLRRFREALNKKIINHHLFHHHLLR